ncbi:hypothetical protein FRC0263_02394 [Corynebacterium diphtheriae]|nr:hypothetical protein FRC0263_02394 [Corynebacterium diphtheriae]
MGGFVFGPVPCDDVVVAGCDEQASGSGVGVVDEALVVDALWVTVVGDVDEPERFESAVKCPTAYLLLLGEFRQRCCGGGIRDEGFKVAGLRFVSWNCRSSGPCIATWLCF